MSRPKRKRDQKEIDREEKTRRKRSGDGGGEKGELSFILTLSCMEIDHLLRVDLVRGQQSLLGQLAATVTQNSQRQEVHG
jgi:hypothetical protein